MRRKVTKKESRPSLKVIPIGGLSEIGKNMTLLELSLIHISEPTRR